MGAIASMGYVFVLLSGTLYMFAVFMTQVVTDYKVASGAEPSGEDAEELLHAFGTLDTSFISFWMTATEGIEWHEYAVPAAKEITPLLIIPFCIVQTFVVLAV